MKKLLFVLCPVAVLSIVIYAMNIHSKASETATDSYEQYYINDELESNITDSDSGITNNTIDGEINTNGDDNVDIDRIDTDPTSITVLVNKTYTLDEDYEPDDLVVPDIKFSFSYYDDKMQLRSEAAHAMEGLFNAALDEGVVLAGVSGYRSYKRQFEIYATNLIRRGVDFTNQYSAMPGASEHQTGLAMDISTKSINYRLSDSFADTKEGIWVAENCYKYGFIVRFQADKTSQTGYSYEPWHIRYVGVELATYLTENHLCLDEYYGYEYDDQIYANVDYDAIIKDYYAMKGINYQNTTIGSQNQTQMNPGDTSMEDFESLEEDLIEDSNDLEDPVKDHENGDTVIDSENSDPQKPSDESTQKPTQAPTNKPSKPSDTPTHKPSETPPNEPTDKPLKPSDEITTPPVENPTIPPEEVPTEPPVTDTPSVPTQEPTQTPTEAPTGIPAESPTTSPIAEPTNLPVTENPTEGLDLGI